MHRIVGLNKLTYLFTGQSKCHGMLTLLLFGHGSHCWMVLPILWVQDGRSVAQNWLCTMDLFE